MQRNNSLCLQQKLYDDTIKRFMSLASVISDAVKRERNFSEFNDWESIHFKN